MRQREIYPRLRITKIKNEGNHLTLNCFDKNGYTRIFIVMGKENIKTFQKRLKEGDIVNLMAEGPIIQRVGKAIDMEV